MNPETQPHRGIEIRAIEIRPIEIRRYRPGEEKLLQKIYREERPNHALPYNRSDQQLSYREQPPRLIHSVA